MVQRGVKVRALGLAGQSRKSPTSSCSECQNPLAIEFQAGRDHAKKDAAYEKDEMDEDCLEPDHFCRCYGKF